MCSNVLADVRRGHLVGVLGRSLFIYGSKHHINEHHLHGRKFVLSSFVVNHDSSFLSLSCQDASVDVGGGCADTDGIGKLKKCDCGARVELLEEFDDLRGALLVVFY